MSEDNIEKVKSEVSDTQTKTPVVASEKKSTKKVETQDDFL